MRAISQYTNFSLQVRQQRQKGLGDGTVEITTEPLYAKFDHDGMIYENEVEEAVERFAFKGQYQHLDEFTKVDPRYRLSVLDTETQGWSDEDKALVEAELVRKAAITGDFFIVKGTPMSAPYPKWDSSTKPAFQLVADLVEMEFDLQAALDYERLFGPKREDVIEALEETLKAQAQETILA
jgi:hypothetical protein